MKILSKADCGVKVRARVVDARTGKTLKSTGWHHNTLMNRGLNTLAAGGVGFFGLFTQINVGSNPTQNYTFNAGITFTQAAFIITASAPIFTSGMIGQLFKYGTGTGGAEYYITGFTDSQHVTVDTSATVATSAGTIWNVIQIALGAYLYTSISINASSSTIVSPGVVSLASTNQFAIQTSPYSVNEIGYTNGGAAGNIMGRIVLPSTIIVPTTSFLVVDAVFTVSFAPSLAPVAVGNVGTNIDTAGTAIWAYYNFYPYQLQFSFFGYENALQDSFSVPALVFATAPFVLPAQIQPGQSAMSSGLVVGTTSSYTNAGIGISIFSCSFNQATTGQTVYGIYLGGGPSLHAGNVQTADFQLLFNTPQTLPNGPFVGSYTFTNVFTRTLSNP